MLERIIAVYTAVIVVPYFVLETTHYIQYGDYLPMVLVDYILMALMVAAAYVSLSKKFGSGAGLLCGAWGYAFCLNWRSYFWRAHALQEGDTVGIAEPIDQVAMVLLVTLVMSGVVFAASLWLARPRNNAKRA